MIDNGCEQDSPIPGAWKIEDWEFQRCPLKIINQQSKEYLKAYQFFDKGYLPNPGSWLEQPAKFIDAMRVISREVQEIEKEEQEKLAASGGR
jgi:hypothetical protein